MISLFTVVVQAQAVEVTIVSLFTFFVQAYAPEAPKGTDDIANMQNRDLHYALLPTPRPRLHTVPSGPDDNPNNMPDFMRWTTPTTTTTPWIMKWRHTKRKTLNQLSKIIGHNAGEDDGVMQDTFKRMLKDAIPHEKFEEEAMNRTTWLARYGKAICEKATVEYEKLKNHPKAFFKARGKVDPYAEVKLVAKPIVMELERRFFKVMKWVDEQRHTDPNFDLKTARHPFKFGPYTRPDGGPFLDEPPNRDDEFHSRRADRLLSLMNCEDTLDGEKYHWPTAYEIETDTSDWEKEQEEEEKNKGKQPFQWNTDKRSKTPTWFDQQRDRHKPKSARGSGSPCPRSTGGTRSSGASGTGTTGSLTSYPTSARTLPGSGAKTGGFALPSSQRTLTPGSRTPPEMDSRTPPDRDSRTPPDRDSRMGSPRVVPGYSGLPPIRAHGTPDSSRACYGTPQSATPVGTPESRTPETRVDKLIERALIWRQVRGVDLDSAAHAKPRQCRK